MSNFYFLKGVKVDRRALGDPGDMIVYSFSVSFSFFYELSERIGGHVRRESSGQYLLRDLGKICLGSLIDIQIQVVNKYRSCVSL